MALKGEKEISPNNRNKEGREGEGGRESNLYSKDTDLDTRIKILNSG